MSEFLVIHTVTEAHEALGVEKPRHPLISVIPQRTIRPLVTDPSVRFRVDLYQIWIKDDEECRIGYGRNSYDFSEGTLAFMRAGQVIHATPDMPPADSEGYLILFHPDLIRKSPLGQTINQLSFFDYDVHEALHISDDERKTLSEIARKIGHEINLGIDRYSQDILISNLDLFLAYSTRYYDRQFYTRTNLNKDLVGRFTHFLNTYYENGQQLTYGIPGVVRCAEELTMSPQYLSDLLKKETGLTAQEHILRFVVDRAKNHLLGSPESVSQVAFDLGFEYPQHFSKLFKSKTGMSPAQYRAQN